MIDVALPRFCAPIKPLLDASRLEEAAGILRKTVLSQPDEAPLLWNALGCLAHELGRWPEAVEHFERAAALAPSCAAYKANLFLAFRAGNQEQTADAVLVEAMLLTPQDLRIERLRLLVQANEPAGQLPMTAGATQGHLFSALPLSDEPVREGRAATLASDRNDIWELDAAPSPHEAALSPRTGLPLIAAVWNSAGLFLKEGRLESATATANGGLRISLKGPKSCRVQRRRHYRILALEEFVQAEELAGLYDLSASGLSYFCPEPPEPRSTLTFTLCFGKSRPGISMTAVVQRCFPTPRRKHRVAVEFLSDPKTLDHLAVLIQERQRSQQAVARASSF